MLSRVANEKHPLISWTLPLGLSSWAPETSTVSRPGASSRTGGHSSAEECTGLFWGPAVPRARWERVAVKGASFM